MIKIQKYEKKSQKLSFVGDMNISLANAIRRYVLEIPIMAIDEVEISQNDSALYDEIIAHRMGLIPLKNSKGLEEARYKLKEKGPKTVYSTDFSPSVETEYKLPIVILEKDQEIEVVAIAKPGKGIDHIKHSPGSVYYKHNIDEDLIDFVDVDDEGKVSFDDEELKNKGLTEEQIKRIKKIQNTNEILFVIEGWGQIEVKDIFLESIKVLEKDLEKLNKIIK
jgi:DNA-directed RNA polymerase subunit D